MQMATIKRKKRRQRRAGKEQIYNEGGMEGGKRCGSGMSGEGAGLEGGA